MRSGVDPVESLQKLQGRIVTFHLKQIKEFGKHTHDVPFGTGNPDFIKKILQEMKKQGFKGVFSIEYEHNPEDPTKDVAQCIAFFDQVAREIAGK